MNDINEDNYKNIEEVNIIKLLYAKVTVISEMHIINLYNTINQYPIIRNPEQLMRFKTYIEFCKQIIIKSPVLMKYCPATPFFYNLDNIKQFLKIHFSITEIFKDNKLIIVRIKENKYEIK